MRNTSLLRRCAITAVVLVGLLQVSAFAFIDTAPSWRDAANDSTTLSIWTFGGTAKEGISPDAGSYNDYGTAGDDWYANVMPSPEEDEWIAMESGAYGVWALSGTLYAVIPNTDVTGPGTSKTMQVQLVWKPQDGFTMTDAGVSMAVEDDNWTLRKFAVTDAQSVTLSNGWYQSIWTIDWIPNPAIESFTITGNIYVDSLIVDTICIPEPATLTIMGLGLAAMLRTRKK
jgi:hypothetical protein